MAAFPEHEAGVLLEWARIGDGVPKLVDQLGGAPRKAATKEQQRRHRIPELLCRGVGVHGARACVLAHEEAVDGSGVEGWRDAFERDARLFGYRFHSHRQAFGRDPPRIVLGLQREAKELVICGRTILPAWGRGVKTGSPLITRLDHGLVTLERGTDSTCYRARTTSIVGPSGRMVTVRYPKSVSSS